METKEVVTLQENEKTFIEKNPLALGLLRIDGPRVSLVASSKSFASLIQGLKGTSEEDFFLFSMRMFRQKISRKSNGTTMFQASP
jgi:hypothetical protein